MPLPWTGWAACSRSPMSSSGPVDSDARVIACIPADEGIFRIALEAPRIASACRPGQFAMLEPSPGAFPVSRRPLTFSSCDPEAGSVTFLFDVAGAGTSILSRSVEGDSVRILGPLGRGWETAPGRWLMVAGGLGIAGFPFLLSTADEAVVMAGTRTGRGTSCCPPGTVLATEDGSVGVRGLITGLLEDVEWDSFDSIAVCGPSAMMRAVVARTPPRVLGRVQVSMESRMGCGWGVCGGCPVPSSRGGFMSCCKDGPVFRACDVDWERIS